MGEWSSRKALERRTQQAPILAPFANGERTVDKANIEVKIPNPKIVGSSQEHGITHEPKSFKEILRECYWKREQARRDHDKPAREIAFMRRLERRQLFGYVLTITGLTLTIDEARRRMGKGKLTRNEILEWHSPEVYTDNILSIGEKDVYKEHSYPALGLEEGAVLSDPKLHYLHPALVH
jgi:hypothetical protein